MVCGLKNPAVPLHCNSGGLGPIPAMTVHLPPLLPCGRSLAAPAGAGRSTLLAVLKAGGEGKLMGMDQVVSVLLSQEKTTVLLPPSLPERALLTCSS